MKTIELDTKILNKNLEMTRISKQLDDLTSDYVALKEQIDLKSIPVHMIDTLNMVVGVFQREEHQGKFDQDLKKKLENVIKFLQK